MDVAIYDQNGNQRSFSNLTIKNQEWTKDIITGLEAKPSAILVNGNNKGYCRSILDKQSLDFFLANMSKISDELNRSYLWRTLWDNLKIGLLTGEQFLQCVLDHFH